MKSNLTLHCGAHLVQREQVVESKTPQATHSWCPIPHGEFVAQVEKALSLQQMTVVEQAHSLTHDGNRYFGLMQVSNCKSTGDDYGYVVGLRNSHDKSYPAGLVVGATVFVCDNLSFSGEIRMARKHTVNIARDLPVLTARAVGLLAQKWTSMNDRIALYKAAQLTDKDANDFMIRAIESGIAPVRQLDTIIKEWRAPRHPEFAETKNAWRLYNAFTEAAKEGSLVALPQRTISLHGLMDAQVNYQPLTTETGIADEELIVQA